MASDKSTAQISMMSVSSDKQKKEKEKKNVFDRIVNKIFKEKIPKTCIDPAFNKQIAVGKAMRTFVSDVSKKYLSINDDLIPQKEVHLANSLGLANHMNLDNYMYTQSLQVFAESGRTKEEHESVLKRQRGTIITRILRATESHCRELDESHQRLQRRNAEMDHAVRDVRQREKDLQESKSREKKAKLEKKLEEARKTRDTKVHSFNTELERLTTLLDEIPQLQQRHSDSFRKTLDVELEYHKRSASNIEKALAKVKQY